MSGENELTAKEAVNVISSYLPVEWTAVNEDDIKISRISGGYMNTVYLVERKSQSILEPNQLIFRRKGGGIIKVETKNEAIADVFASEVEEALVTVEAAKATVGPVVYGLFAGGRIEEYVQSRTLTPQDVLDKGISESIAKAFARFHCMQIPYRRGSFHKVQRLICSGISQFQENIHYLVDPFIANVFNDAPGPIDWDYIKAFDYASEFLWACKVLDQVTYRMVMTAGEMTFR